MPVELSKWTLKLDIQLLIKSYKNNQVSYSDITANLNTYVISAGQDKRIMVLDFGYDLTLI